MRIDASQGVDGRFKLRTSGLVKQRRPELELACVPEGALHAAGGLLNLIGEYSVNRDEIKDGQTVGNVLAVGEDTPLLVVVRAHATNHKPQGGLFANLVGANKGVLRITDAIEAKQDPTGAPIALATMLIHRAKAREAQANISGAREELALAISLCPGEATRAGCPTFEGAAGVYNDENHLAYAALANLEDSPERAAAHFENALVRSLEYTRIETGAPLATIFALDEGTLRKEATRILEHNLANTGLEPTSNAMATLLSPIWENWEPSGASRRLARLPRDMVSSYYEGPVVDALQQRGPTLVAKIMTTNTASPARVAWTARSIRSVWTAKGATLTKPFAEWQVAMGLVSTLLADVGRCLRAKANDEEILARYVTAAKNDANDTLLQSVATKLAALEEFEGDAYMRVMSPP